MLLRFRRLKNRPQIRESGNVRFRSRRKKHTIDQSVVSVFDMFSIGIGPSSSHTVGPMKAAYKFVEQLKEKKLMNKVHHVKTELYGSLALTGEGHGTLKAVLMGLEGETPENVDPLKIVHRVIDIRTNKRLNLGGERKIEFANDHLLLLKDEPPLDLHSNGMKLYAFDKAGKILFENTFFSVGGGFIQEEHEMQNPGVGKEDVIIPSHMFHDGQQLLELCEMHKLSIAELQLKNEISMGKTEKEVKDGLFHIWEVMNASIDRGFSSKEEILPGGLNTRRRAPYMYNKLLENGISMKLKPNKSDSIEGVAKLTGQLLNWLSAYALSVNEENAAGGKIVTSPTNGASGVIPAVLRCYTRWMGDSDNKYEDVTNFMLTAGAIGILYKKGASLSAAEVGCQGEIGVACSMAAGALCAVLGGTPNQVEMAAEIGMEHHLGMTCDPIGGLVQIPCIERNTMGGVKAFNAAQLALVGDGRHIVTLDQVIATMYRTGTDMKSKYKETSLGGLAVHVGVPNC
eukprot:TRINITY_DN7632_c0_g1_i1.p1 TRINITY_DN7632_c0_g1~~TRINITY_DN7632_c0_g1_i1.p1  ORF type:complete len:513 (+),score=112.58 TRINITY_DN7632_c0_g1_i1:17-1555(+)